MTAEPDVAAPRRAPGGLGAGQVWTLVVVAAIALTLTVGGLVPVLRGDGSRRDGAGPGGSAPLELDGGTGGDRRGR